MIEHPIMISFAALTDEVGRGGVVVPPTNHTEIYLRRDSRDAAVFNEGRQLRQGSRLYL